MKKIVLTLLIILLLTPASHASSNDINFRFGALGVAFGVLKLDLDFKIGDSWTLGPSIAGVRRKVDSNPAIYSEDFKVTGGLLGLRANWFDNGAFNDGFYVGPALNYIHVKVKTTDLTPQEITATGSTLFASCVVGYGWFWDSFNMMLGVGLGAPLGDREVTVTDSSGTKKEDVDFSGRFVMEYTLGWTF